MPTEHGFISDLKYYFKKKRLIRYLRGEAKQLYWQKKKKWSYLLEDTLWYRFDPLRVLAKKFEENLPALDSNYVEVGNYYLDDRIRYDSPPVVYSLGVLTDITFDKAVANRYNTQVYMFDPAPVAIEYMSKQTDERLMFFPVGVWVEDCTMPFMYSKDRGRSPSMFIAHDGGVFNAACKSITTIMGELEHQQIDILKMDIEGAALPLLEHMLTLNIPLPGQIVVEFENINPDLRTFCDFYLRVITLIDTLQGKGYQVVNLPRDYSLYRSVELLFSRIEP